jgi:hypothetical protein
MLSYILAYVSGVDKRNPEQPTNINAKIVIANNFIFIFISPYNLYIIIIKNRARK